MKKVILLMVFIFLSNNIFAETPLAIKQGNYLVGGGLSANYFKKDYAIFSINIYPNIGYFVMDNLAFGIAPNYYTSISSAISNSWQIGLDIFGKYYFDNGFIFETNLGIVFLPKNEISFSIFPSIGYAYFINKNVSLEGSIGPKFLFGNVEYFQIPLFIGFQVFL